ncbi:MAG: hypothetical protein WDZ35_15170 [Crocinitomicaceae bacterium]
MRWKVYIIRHSNCPFKIPGIDLFDTTPIFNSYQEADEYRNSLKKFEYLTYQLVPMGFVKQDQK